MTVIDTLQILINADSRGIEQTLKKVIQTATGTVDNINKQEVDWTSIFTRSVTPALIGGVASMFAFAISQSLQFQQALNQTGTAAGQNSAQIAMMGQSALNLSTQVPASAQDIATAMAQVSAIFGSTADQQAVVAAMAELAASGFGSLNDIVSVSTDLFKQFGVTTTDQAISVLTSLMHGAEGAKETIPALAAQFTSFSDQLPAANKNVDSFNGLIATFASEIQNVGAAGAQSIFAALAASASNTVGPMELLGTSFSEIQKSLLTDGGLTAIINTSNALQKMGPGASLVATNFGLSAAQVGQFQTNASKLPQVISDAKAIATNTQTIADANKLADNSLRELILDWNKLVKVGVDLGSSLLPLTNIIADIFVTGLEDADNFFKGVTDGFGSMLSLFYGNNLKSAVTGLFSGLGNALDSVLGSPALQTINGITSMLSGGTSANTLNAALQHTGVNGFSSGILSRIDQSASQNGLMESLISALSTGGKGNQYSQMISTFNLTLPQGGNGWTPKDLANALYKKFQGQ